MGALGFTFFSWTDPHAITRNSKTMNHDSSWELGVLYDLFHCAMSEADNFVSMLIFLFFRLRPFFRQILISWVFELLLFNGL